MPLIPTIGLLDVFYAREQTHTRKQMAGIKWFDDVIVGTCMEAGNFVLERGLRGKNHNGEVKQRWMMPHKTTEIQSVLLAEQHLDNQHIGYMHLQEELRLRE